MANPFLRRAFAGFRIARALAGDGPHGERAASERDAGARTAKAKPSLPPLSTIRLLGVDVANLTFAEAVDRIVAWSRDMPPRTVITTNLDHVMKLRGDAEFRRCYDEADMVTADGMPFVWLAKHEGEPLKERVTGSDLILPLMEAAAREGRSVFLFGSTIERLDGAAQILKARLPELDFRGAYAPPFGFDRDPALHDELVTMLRTVRPDIILVALGAPKQEIWSNKMAGVLRHGVFVSIGGGLDFLSGDVKRAPTLMRKTGTEWMWRAVTEPARLGPRYARIIWTLPALYRAHRRDRAEHRAQPRTAGAKAPPRRPRG